MFFRAPQAKIFAIVGVFVLERMHFSARKVMCAPARPYIPKPAAESPNSHYAPSLHTSCACFFILPQNAYALLGKRKHSERKRSP